MSFDVLLVDLDEIMRKRIKAILGRCGDFGVVSQAENRVAALQFIKQHKPALVLMGIVEPGAVNGITTAGNETTSNAFADLILPGVSGVDITAETITEILRHHPECRVVILSVRADEDLVVRAVRSGARGLVLKGVSDAYLLEAMRVVANGGAYLSPQISDLLATRIQKGDLESNQDSAPFGLSPREIQVMGLVAEGKTNKEIATLLDLSEQKVRSYRKTMLKKLGVNWLKPQD